MTSGAQLVSPKQAARAMGVSESSLKRWCDGGLLRMTRTAGGHRKIAIGEVIRFASRNGTTLVVPEEFSLLRTREGPASDIGSNSSRLADALLSGNEIAAQQILMDLFLANHSVAALCDEVIAPAFREIGDRWNCQSANIYQERRGCEIIIWILHEMRRVIPPFEQGRLAIGGTISGDAYEIPSHMAELTLRSIGYHAQNLGALIPIEELAQAVRDLRPQLCWLSVSHLLDEPGFIKQFAQLSAACSDAGASLVVGGRALSGELRRSLTYSAHCDTMKHLESFGLDLKRWSSRSGSTKRRGQPGRGTSRRQMRPNALKRRRTP